MLTIARVDNTEAASKIHEWFEVTRHTTWIGPPQQVLDDEGRPVRDENGEVVTVRTTHLVGAWAHKGDTERLARFRFVIAPRDRALDPPYDPYAQRLVPPAEPTIVDGRVVLVATVEDVPETTPPTRLLKSTIWRRLTPAEQKNVMALGTGEADTAAGLSADDQQLLFGEWVSIQEIDLTDPRATQVFGAVFGADRAAELLAPEVPA